MKVKIRDTDTVIKEVSTKYSRSMKRKYMHKTGMSKERFNALFETDPEIILDTITEGSKVKLKYDYIMESSSDKSELWLKFVEEHKDEVLTVEYDEKHKDHPTVFCLKEDTNPVKWLFDISELEVIEMAAGAEPIEKEDISVSENMED